MVDDTPVKGYQSTKQSVFDIVPVVEDDWTGTTIPKKKRWNIRHKSGRYALVQIDHLSVAKHLVAILLEIDRNWNMAELHPDDIRQFRSEVRQLQGDVYEYRSLTGGHPVTRFEHRRNLR